MGFSHIALYSSTVPVSALGMGIGVDYALYVTSRLQDEIKIKRQSPKEAYINCFITSGKAVFFTAMSVTCGVLTWYFSDLKFQWDMGIMLAVVLTMNMLGALFILPSLITHFKPKFIFQNETIE